MSGPAPGARTAPVVAFGGDVILGARQNGLTARDGPAQALAGVPELAAADLAIVNLECVIAGAGAPVAKGTPFAFHFRGRPELLAVLAAAGIDVVATANNHSGDYGTEALLEQSRLLDGMRLGQAGSGSDHEAACRPVFRHAGALTVALFAVDATMPAYAATADRPGTCYLPPDDASAWLAFFQPRITAARRSAHIVLVAVHCGPDFEPRPREHEIALCRALIEAGADAVLGSSTHLLQGVEIYRGRPIFYDAGNLLAQHPRRVAEAAVFSLVLAPDGVQQVRATPVAAGYGASRSATGEQARAILTTLRDRSAELGATLVIEDGRGLIDLPPLPPRAAPPEAAPPDPPPGPPPAPQPTPPAGCVVPTVPEAARIEPVAIGPLTLLGVAVEPRVLTEGTRLRLDTYWMIEGSIADDLAIAVRVEPVLENGLRWQGDHEPCDWAWPTSRWTPGTIYHDRFGLRPPGRPRQRMLQQAPAAPHPLVASQLVVWIGLNRWGEPVATEQAVARLPCETRQGELP